MAKALGGEGTRGEGATGESGRSAPTGVTGSPWPRLAGRFERALGGSVVVVIVPVIVLLLAALASFAYGTVVFLSSIVGIVDNSHLTSQNLHFLLLLTDLFLIGATLMIAAFGFYELFIQRIGVGGQGMPLPGWLKMHDLNDLKARVISMLILVVSVTFADVAVEVQAGLDILYLGVGVAAVIAALTVFLRFGHQGRADQ